MRATALALLILLAAPATAGAQDAGEIASALRRDPVYVARGADPDLSVAERGRLRLRIVRTCMESASSLLASPPA